VGQLLNKTNQMNLSTRRLSELELFGWLQAPGNFLWTFRVSDKLGDSGLTGIASVSITEQRAHVVDFVLSCRVMGRHVEELMMHVLTASARAHGATELVAVHRPTPKNNPCLEFLRRSGLSQIDSHTFVWTLSQDYPAPAHISVDLPSEILAGAATGSIRQQ
jgi:FkbH-like protein